MRAIADAPTLSGSAAGPEDTAIPVTVTVGLVDQDGSETLQSVTITGIPIGATLAWTGLPAGATATPIMSGADIVGYTFAPADDSSSATADLQTFLSNNLTITPKLHSGDNITLAVSATTIESHPVGGEVQTLTATTNANVVIDVVRQNVPFVAVDLPHTWNSWVKHTLLAADDAIIVAGPDLASLRNTKNIIDLLKSMRPYDSPPTVVLSMVGVPKRPEIPFKDFAEALGAEPIASFPFDPALFGMAANNGQMIGEVAPQGKTALAIDALAASLTGRKPVEQKKATFVDKIPFLKR